jgi:hypothetical protein
VPAKRVKQRIAAHLVKRRLPAELVLTQIAMRGGRDSADWRKHHPPGKK